MNLSKPTVPITKFIQRCRLQDTHPHYRFAFGCILLGAKSPKTPTYMKVTYKSNLLFKSQSTFITYFAIFQLLKVTYFFTFNNINKKSVMKCNLLYYKSVIKSNLLCYFDCTFITDFIKLDFVSTSHSL